ncbi:MAG: hypothetical protein UT17_C0017G0012 [Candidatus Woesebacteria bacterium GW2011_GWB1_39_10]|uniref:DUF202 domain-containing protein n=1 Tax=Candidatus Woesebacteria bacterium GW2011_GWB1_39_10 TaxID=1618572 RepID=A0A0G0NZ68_9BACT|nr:MAG: hypothetical protein UT17_C0017G0012 [Candidatus Woesebacteria bacterium GW2011_GWB1_39_10]
MDKLDQSLDSMKEAKKFSLGFKIEALQQLVLQRFQALTTISAISFAVSGIVISSDNSLIHNKLLALFSATLFIFIALVSLGRHLYLLREGIDSISQKIKNFSGEDWSKPLKEKSFEADWWPETLYIFLIVGVLLFGISLIEYSYSI